MANILLTGAGFSRNWGGWLAFEAFNYLIGHADIVGNQELRDLLWKYQNSGGFEETLAVLQNAAATGDQMQKANLAAMYGALTDMFKDMNAGFVEVGRKFEFTSYQDRTVGEFLAKFNAIFTLNQDLLLEHNYIDCETPVSSARRWDGSSLPGMRQMHGSESGWAKKTWIPGKPENFVLDAKCQPYFKLHGSSNWKESDGGPLLIMGGNKAREIGRSSILSWYFDEFKRRLEAPGAKLMVIGYGFRDEHVNRAIADAIENHGLRMFLISPDGVQPAQTATALTEDRKPLGEVFQRGLIGVSQRPMKEIFGSDSIEFNKVNKFFS